MGDGVIIPGLVNAHTHLEFSDLENPLGQPGIKFTDWIRLIVARRNESNQASESTEPGTNKRAAIRRGIEESFLAGVWALGEISTQPYQLEDYQTIAPNMTGVCFLEQLGRSGSTLEQKRDELAAFLEQPTGIASGCLQMGSSPHAPYSVGPQLLKQICRQTAEADRPIAMHLAETLMERELIEHQTGDFVSLLKDLGVWDRISFENGLSIGETIQVLATAPSSLIVHGNYLTDRELDLVAANSDRQSIVYCPRTHAFFGHPTYPLEQMLRREINVCLGTDSRASNPDLDLFQEAKQLSSSFAQIDPRSILRMATLGGASALRIDAMYGSLTVGKKPALSFLSHPNAGSDQSPWDWMYDNETKCIPAFHR